MAEIDFTPDLVEEAVFLAMRRLEEQGAAAARAWARERELAYSRAPGPDRDHAFRSLAQLSFRQLDLAAPVRRALALCPLASRGLSVVYVRRAWRARDEGSELYGSPAVHPEENGAHMVIGVRPERFLDAAALEEFALREILYAEDMLDFSFGFTPALPLAPEGEIARRELVRDRFRLLWEARVAGRMARLREGASTEPAPGERFRRAFGPAADPEAIAELFRAAWSGRLATQDVLLAKAVAGAPPAPALAGS